MTMANLVLVAVIRAAAVQVAALEPQKKILYVTGPKAGKN
jgi:hypothetical protein